MSITFGVYETVWSSTGCSGYDIFSEGKRVATFASRELAEEVAQMLEDRAAVEAGEAVEWEWYGNPGHHICGKWMRFHLHTYVGGYIVSTVGEYVHPRHSGGSEKSDHEWWSENWPGEDVGAGRKYETYVFRASGDRCTNEECGCNAALISCWSEVDGVGANNRGVATKNHMEMCRKYAARVTVPLPKEADDDDG